MVATSGTERDVVHLPGAAMGSLVRAVLDLSTADVGPYAIVGGVAVVVRLGRAHRATSDVDAVVEVDRSPTAIDVLRALPDAHTEVGVQPHRVRLHGTIVEVLPVGPSPADDELEWLPEIQRLFVLAHAWALETATAVTVTATDRRPVRATALFATPASLVAMKLHAIQDRSGDGSAKRAADAWDLHQLLTSHDQRGALADAIRQGPASLRRAVAAAAQRLLVAEAVRVSGWLHGVGGPGAEVTADELAHLGERFVTRLGTGT